MDRQLLERLIGAGVLLVILVIVVPAILDDPAREPAQGEAVPADDASSAMTQPRRTHTIRLDQKPQSPPVAKPVNVTESSGTITQADPTADRQPAATEKSTASEPIVASAPPEKTSTVSAEKPAPVVAVSTPEPKPAVKVAPKPVPQATPKPAPVPAGKTTWAVQLGSFSQQPNAAKLVEQVKAKGFPGYLMTSNESGKTLYRVRVGPRSSREAAVKLADQLKAGGYNGMVTSQEAGPR